MQVSEQKRLCPVLDGDIWRHGRHWFACGDLTDSRVLTRLLELAPAPTLMYSDPPWNDGDSKRYRTLSERDGASGRSVDWEALFRRVLRPAADRDLLAYIEMSRASHDRAQAIARAMGARTDHSWDVHYRPGVTESTMFTADFRPFTGAVAAIDGPVARTAPEQALAGHEPGVVLDVCTGNGWTALAAHRAGWTFIGHELTPRRMWTAMKRCGTTGYELIERAGDS